MNAISTKLLNAVAAAPIRLFRIRWAWRYGNRTHFATTTWGARTPKDAVSEFCRHKPTAISASIVEELRGPNCDDGFCNGHNAPEGGR